MANKQYIVSPVIILILITLMVPEAQLKSKPIKASERSDGIFRAFLKDLILIIASDEFEPKLKQYLRILQDVLVNMEYEIPLKMAGEIVQWFERPEGYIKNKLMSYRQALDRHPHYRNRFFIAMNELFREAQETDFNDYLEKVKHWNKIKTTVMDDTTLKEQTRKVIYDVIIERVHKYGPMDQGKLVSVLLKAVEEYSDVPEWGLPGRVVHEADARKKHGFYFQDY